MIPSRTRTLPLALALLAVLAVGCGAPEPEGFAPGDQEGLGTKMYAPDSATLAVPNPPSQAEQRANLGYAPDASGNVPE
ncbi:MAG: hypothetical protein MH204_04210 [Fimbriimonadaceae bacterium]|nr:hypothetical protein [Fimbriimonadaceae bacterium]